VASTCGYQVEREFDIADEVSGCNRPTFNGSVTWTQADGGLAVCNPTNQNTAANCPHGTLCTVTVPGSPTFQGVCL
jgi:hypothetical protein